MNEKHKALAEKIMTPLKEATNAQDTFHAEEDLKENLITALNEAYEQGKASQVALRIEGPSEDEINEQIFRISWKKGPEEGFSSRELAQWMRDNLKVDTSTQNGSYNYPSDDELLKRNKKYVDANKSRKNDFDCLDFAYYHGQLDLIDDIQKHLRQTEFELVLPKEKDLKGLGYSSGFNEALDAIKKLNTHLKTRVEGE